MTITTGHIGQDAGIQAGVRPRLDSLTSLRWFAAFMVFAFHLSPLAQRSPALAWMDPLLRPGPVGVSFFFILSGFVLTWSRREGDTPRRFWRRRFARVYPNHIVMLIVAAAVIVYEGHRLSLPVAALNTGLVQAWFPRPAVFLGMNSVAWSLSCEAFFYASFPLLYRMIAPRSLKSRRLLLGALAGWIVLAALALLPANEASPKMAALYVFPPMRLAEFVIGILLAREVASATAPRVRVGHAVGLVVLGYLGAAYAPPPLQVVAVTLAPFSLLIVAAAQASAEGRARWLHAPKLIFLGEISYAMYLVHQLVLRVIAKSWSASSTAAVLAMMAAGLVIAVVCSWALFARVERPAERRLRHAPERVEAPRQPERVDA